jgi:hypothetical protein
MGTSYHPISGREHYMNKTREAARAEALAAQKEAAAAIALESGRGFPMISKPFKIKAFLIILIVFLLAGAAGLTYFKLFAGKSAESQTLSIVESVHELATLATAEAVVTTVIKEEDNKIFDREISINLPGTKRTSLLIIPATVIAGVDLSQVTEDNIKINHQDKEITLTLPHAKIIQEPSIQMDKVQTYSEEGLFRSEVNWDEGFDLAAKANMEIKNEAMKMGILLKAEDSTEKILSRFFQKLGYTTNIQFDS